MATTTSGAANFNLDLSELVEEAFERAGSEMRTGYDLRTARRSLNLLFADWANRGINMWTFEQKTITLVTGQPTYALPDDTVDILDHVIRTQANQINNQADLTITRISISTYATIPNKLIQARPIQVYVQRLTANDQPTGITVAATVSSSATTIQVSSLAGLPTAGFIKIGTELIFYNETSNPQDGAPLYLYNCCRGQDGTTAASHAVGDAITLSQKQSITVWPTPDPGQTYQFVYWRMRRTQNIGNGTNIADVPFRFLPCLVAGLAYYIALKVPGGMDRLPLLKQQYDEAWDLASGEDHEKAAVRFVPRQMFIGSGT
jgi:hypothetical protein